jgi:hypothetical protein
MCFTFAGEEQTAEDAEDGPPELLFIHGGHTAKISGQNKEAIFQKAVCEKKNKVIFLIFLVEEGWLGRGGG